MNPIVSFHSYRPLPMPGPRFAGDLPPNAYDPNDPHDFSLETYEDLRVVQHRFRMLNQVMNQPNPVRWVESTAGSLNHGSPVLIELADGQRYAFSVYHEEGFSAPGFVEVFRLEKRPAQSPWLDWLPSPLRRFWNTLNRDELYLKETVAKPNNRLELRVIHGFHEAQFWNDDVEREFSRPEMLDLARETFYRLEVLVEQAIAKKQQNPQA